MGTTITAVSLITVRERKSESHRNQNPPLCVSLELSGRAIKRLTLCCFTQDTRSDRSWAISVATLPSSTSRDQKKRRFSSILCTIVCLYPPTSLCCFLSSLALGSVSLWLLFPSFTRFPCLPHDCAPNSTKHQLFLSFKPL